MSTDIALMVESSQPIAPAANRTRQPRVWTVFAVWFIAAITGLVAAIAGFVVAGLGIGIVLGAQGVDAAAIQSRVQEMLQQPLPALLLTLLPFQGGMLLVVLLAAWRSPQPLAQRLGLAPQAHRTFGGLSLAAMAGFTLSTALATVIGSSLLLGQPAVNPVGAAIQSGSWWVVALVSVILSVIPGLVEEIVFRGYIQRRLLERWSPAVAIGVSTLLFAILHADSLQHIIAVVPLGLVTGLLAFRTNSVRPGMVVHAIHNVGVVGLAVLAQVLMPLIGDEGVGVMIVGALVVLGLLSLPAIISLLRRSPLPQAALAQEVPQAAQSLVSSAA